MNIFSHFLFVNICDFLINKKNLFRYKTSKIIFSYKSAALGSYFKHNYVLKNQLCLNCARKFTILNSFQKKKPNKFFKFFFKNNFIIYYFFNSHLSFFYKYKKNTFLSKFNFIKFFSYLRLIYKKTFGEGFVYVRGLVIIFWIDACFTDDEPLWEPLEWSLVQTWLFFIFMFAWVAENLITSRYGSYTGRDKRVWFAWYKSFWLLEFWYAISYASAALFVIVPFYYELTYNISFVFSWWNWYTRIFFFKFISLFSLIIFLAYFFQLNIRFLNWKKLLFLVFIINIFIGYLLYTHFIISFFGYFTNPLWYQKTRFVDYIQLSHEPLKWGWGPAKRDHFTYHKVSTVFWFKNDGPFAGAFLMIHLFFFFSLFMLYIYWIILFRKIYTTKEVTYTFSTYCVSSLRQFFYFFFLFYCLIIVSFLINYWRFPIEFLWIVNANSWGLNFIKILTDYFYFLIEICK